MKPIYKNTDKYIESVFPKNSYANIIDEVVSTEKTRENVRKIIPILVRWAKQGIVNNTYGDLIKELGYVRYSGIGSLLGRVHDVLQKLSKLTGEDIPTLNALVKKTTKSKSMGMPSSGFSYVASWYEKMLKDANAEEKKKIIKLIMNIDREAIEYEHWDWVLSSLGLTPSIINTTASETLIRSGKYYGLGGESEHHKKLKEYVYNHPEVLGISDIKKKEMEYILLSGDRLDVYFELNDGTRIAVEVKSSISSDADIMRGLFQCVKYKAVLNAEQKIHSKKANNQAILVIGGELSSENCKVRDALGIHVMFAKFSY